MDINHIDDSPPVAAVRPEGVVVDNRTFIDDYRWLSDKGSPEVQTYLRAENAYTKSVMRRAMPFVEKLYKEIMDRTKQTDVSVPIQCGDYFYYRRIEAGKQYPIYCRRTLSTEAEEEIILDLNDLATGKSFLDLGVFAVSDDGNLLMYSIDTDGSRDYTLYVKDLRRRNLLPEHIEHVTSATWGADNRTLFITVEGPAKRSYRLYRHTLGEREDDLVYEEADEGFVLAVQRSRNRAFVMLTVGSHTTSEVWYLPADVPTEEFRLIAPREHNHLYFVDHHGDHFYIRTNDVGPNFRIVTAPVHTPWRINWQEIIAHSDTCVLEHLDVFEWFYVVLLREKGLLHLQVTDIESGAIHQIEFPEPVYEAYPDDNPEFSQRIYRFRYESLTTPLSIYEHDVITHETSLLKQTEVRGYDPSRYQSMRIFVQAADGTQIPVSLVFHKGTRWDGTLPMLLGAYGAYGLPAYAGFSPSRVSLLERGVVFALAQVRGGGDMGKRWHDAGRRQWKTNTFTDFIAVAEYFVANRYTSPDRLVIHGASAGGLLMGAVVNMRPHLFAAVVIEAPFVDVLNTLLDPSLPLTVLDYEEFGNSSDPTQRRWIEQYCPYTNLHAQHYPAMLVKASLNDPLVMYWQAAKYVAKLRRLKTDNNPLLLKIDMHGGHTGSSGRYDQIRNEAFVLAFILTQR